MKKLSLILLITLFISASCSASDMPGYWADYPFDAERLPELRQSVHRTDLPIMPSDNCIESGLEKLDEKRLVTSFDQLIRGNDDPILVSSQQATEIFISPGEKFTLDKLAVAFNYLARNFKKLQSLKLSCANLTNNDIALITAERPVWRKRLKSLDLSYNNLTADVLPSLVETFSGLTALNLSGNRIGYRGVKSLSTAEFATTIKYLNLTNTGIEDLALAGLQKRFPKAKILL